MKALDALSIINDLAASQRGLFTSAQAQANGVGKVTLSRLADYGHVERLRHGVYRASGAPPLREEGVLAAWMSLDPRTPSYARPKGPGDFVACLNTAAWLAGIGELNPSPMAFSFSRRHQTRDGGMTFLRRELEASDVTTVCGIPTTTAPRTVIDLVEHGEDLSLVSNVLHDALAAGLVPDEDSLGEKVDQCAKRRGLEPGFPLYRYLREAR